MKSIIIILLSLIPVSSFSQGKLEFKKPLYNFGFMREGEVDSTYYEFKNTGDKDAVITEVQVECGCTAAEVTKEPIKPGETGRIKITFNSDQKYGRQERKAKVVTNSGEYILTFKATVLKKKKK